MAFHLTRVSRRSRRLHPLWSLWPVKQPNMNKVSQEGDEIPSQTCQTTKYEGGMHALPRYLSLQQCQTCLKRRKLYVPLFEPKRKLKCPSDIILIGNSRSPIATKHHMWGSPVHAPYSCSVGYRQRLPSLSHKGVRQNYLADLANENSSWTTKLQFEE